MTALDLLPRCGGCGDVFLTQGALLVHECAGLPAPLPMRRPDGGAAEAAREAALRRVAR